MGIDTRLAKLEAAINSELERPNDDTPKMWIWTVPPRYLGVTLEEFEKLPVAERIAMLLDSGQGYWTQ